MSEAPLVLIVDDFDDNREMFGEFLALSGFRVAEASTGAEAIERAIALVPDIVLMDVTLPDVDGWEVTRRLKANAATGHVPVVALTGHSGKEYEGAAKAAGCDAFLLKPCAPDALVAEIRRLLSLRDVRAAT